MMIISQFMVPQNSCVQVSFNFLQLPWKRHYFALKFLSSEGVLLVDWVTVTLYLRGRRRGPRQSAISGPPGPVWSEGWSSERFLSVYVLPRMRRTNEKFFDSMLVHWWNNSYGLELVWVIAWFEVIFGINTTSDISKLFYIISRAIRRVKFEAILKYHKWYLCQVSHKFMLLIVYTTTWEIQSSNAMCLFLSHCFAS